MQVDSPAIGPSVQPPPIFPLSIEDENAEFESHAESERRFQELIQSLVTMADDDRDPTPPPPFNPQAFEFAQIPLSLLFNFRSNFWNSYTHLSAATRMMEEVQMLDYLEEENMVSQAENS